MNCSVVESPINRIQSVDPLSQGVKNNMQNHEPSIKNDSEDCRQLAVELYPWFSDFREKCNYILLNQNMASLAELMQYYTRNINSSVMECYTKPLQAVKLKDFMNKTLLFFLYIYRGISVDCNKFVYLENMSDLLAKYVDMELKASKQRKEEPYEISSRLTTCLYIYLEHSTEHLLDTLIKMQLIRHIYQDILNPVIKKIMKNVPDHPKSNLMYIRYFLVFRLWRKMNKDTAVKNEITEYAVKSLGLPPPNFPPRVFEAVLPKVPKSPQNSTKYLLQYKIDVKRVCEVFIKYCRDSREDTKNQGSTGNIKNILVPPQHGYESEKQQHLVTRKNFELVQNKNDSILDNKITHTSNSFNKSSEIQNSLDQQNSKSSQISITGNSFNLAEDSNNLISETNVKEIQTVIKSELKTLSPLLQQNSKSLTTISKDDYYRKKAKKLRNIVLIDLTTDIIHEQILSKHNKHKLKWLAKVKKSRCVSTASGKIKDLQSKIDNIDVSNISGNEDQHEDTACSQSALFAEDNVSGLNINSNPLLSTEITVNMKKTVDSESNLMKSLDFKNSNNLTSSENTCGNTRIEETNPSSRLNHNECVKDDSKCIDLLSVNNINKIRGDLNDKKAFIGPDKQLNNESNSSDRSILEDMAKPDSDNVDHINRNHCVQLGSSKANEITLRVNEKDIDSESYSVKESEVDTLKVNIKDVNLTAVHTNNRELIKDQLTDRNNSHSSISDKSSSKNIVFEFDSTMKDKYNLKEKALVSEIETNDCCISKTNNKSPNKNRSRGALSIGETYESISELQKVNELSNVGSTKCALSFSAIKNDQSDIQAELEISNCVEVRDANEMKNIVVNSIDENNDLLINYSERFERVEEAKRTENDNITLNSALSEKLLEDSLKGPEEFENPLSINSTKSNGKNSHKISPITQVRESTQINKTSENVQYTEMKEITDGLSLLASVSQRLPRLHSESKLKYGHIKVRDYAILRSSTPDEQCNDNKSLEMTSHYRFKDNNTSDINNKMVGIFPEDALEKVALHVEVTSSNEPDEIIAKNDNEITFSTGHEVVCDTDVVPTSLNSTENNIQYVKENTNVILNGETVVLLQKSPNSNLYIINKAVENGQDQNNEEEVIVNREKDWTSPTDEYLSFEVVNPIDHSLCNLDGLDISQYKEMSHQESKRIHGRNKGIKIELENINNANLIDMKTRSKNDNLPNDTVLTPGQHVFQDVAVMNTKISKPIDKQKSVFKSSVDFSSGIKQEYSEISNHKCDRQTYNSVRSHTQDVESQHSLHIPVTHPNTVVSSIYGNYPATTELYMPYHKRYNPVTCSLQINSSTPLHQYSQAANACERSHCTCNCTYDIVTHCRQCIIPTAETHMSCIESSSYFLPTHSKVQTSVVQECENTKNDTVITKLYDNELICEIEESIISKPLKDVDGIPKEEEMYKKTDDIKLPFKKRLKAHAMSVANNEVPLKAKAPDSYPGVPMMSIAALEQTEKNTEITNVSKSLYSLPHENKDNVSRNQQNKSDLIRRDYCKDVLTTNVIHSAVKEIDKKQNRKKIETTIVDNGSEKSNPDVHLESSVKTTKRSPKESKTRSSRRKIPKVDYSYNDFDPEWNPSANTKRRRKRTDRYN